MVQRGEDAADDDKEDGSVYVAGNKIDGKKVEVFAHEKFHGMDVNGISVPSTWRFLSVVVLVDERIDKPQMQKLVETEVEEVIHDVEKDEGAERIGECELVEGLQNRGRVNHNLCRIKDEDNGGQSIKRYERKIECL